MGLAWPSSFTVCPFLTMLATRKVIRASLRLPAKPAVLHMSSHI